MFLISENHILLLSWFIVNQMYSNVTNNAVRPALAFQASKAV